jgi:hypothetical protein
VVNLPLASEWAIVVEQRRIEDRPLIARQPGEHCTRVGLVFRRKRVEVVPDRTVGESIAAHRKSLLLCLRLDSSRGGEASPDTIGGVRCSYESVVTVRHTVQTL